MSNMVVCENVSKQIGDFKLKDIGFVLPKGYVMGIIGRNGCGKTTLLRCLMGMYRVDSGSKLKDGSAEGKTGRTEGTGVNTTDQIHEGEEGRIHQTTNFVYINGIGSLSDEKTYKKQFAYVSHENPFLDSYKVKELGELFGCYYDGFTMKRYLENLEKFEIPVKSTIVNLSKGQQIKVQLAFALSLDVKVYIFDEPTGNLDVEFRDEFYQTIRELMADGEKSVIYASHLVEELEEIADYILWLHKEENVGKVKFFGTTETLREQYRMLEGSQDVLAGIAKEKIVGGRNRENHGEWLVRFEGLTKEQGSIARYPDLKEIMYYEEKGEVE